MDLSISLSLSAIHVERECESGLGRVWSLGNGGPHKLTWMSTMSGVLIPAQSWMDQLLFIHSRLSILLCSIIPEDWRLSEVSDREMLLHDQVREREICLFSSFCSLHQSSDHSQAKCLTLKSMFCVIQSFNCWLSDCFNIALHFQKNTRLISAIRTCCHLFNRVVCVSFYTIILLKHKNYCHMEPLG